MPDDMENFEPVHFTEADRFLQAIAPVALLATKTPSPEFIFRGHGNADWELTPSALRRDKASGRTKAIALLDAFAFKGTADEQAWSEIRALKMFIESCDREGIAIPGDGYEFRATWMDDNVGELQSAYLTPPKWPFPPHLSLLAFAQHHGIPTRLLDWTRSATVAAYFAASDAVAVDTSGDLAVWALNIELIHIYKGITRIPMPGGNSQRLAAQAGLFTLVASNGERGQLVNEPSFAAALVSKNEDRTKPKPLWKLTLPRSEALRLLYLCDLNGISAATVYPGIEGAAKAALERMAWSRTSPASGRSAANMRPLRGMKIESQRPRPKEDDYPPSGSAM